MKFLGGWSLLFLLFFPSLSRADSWTVLIYWAVDNDLYEFSIPFLRQFERVGSNTNLNLVVETDYPGVSRKSERSLVLRDDGTPGRSDLDLPHSMILETLPLETRSARPGNLLRFMDWGRKHFPADHYILVIGSHGMNWRGIIEDGSREEVMSLSSLRAVLSRFAHRRGVPVELLVLDACRMAFGEVLHELQGTAEFLTGSQFDVNGFDHASPLLELAAHPGLSPLDLGRLYVHHYPKADAAEPGYSAGLLSLDPVRALNFDRDVDQLAERVLDLPHRDLETYRSRLVSTQNEYRDRAFDFAHLTELLPGGESLRDRYLPRIRMVDALGAGHESGFDPASPVLSSSSTRGTGPAHGLSINCSPDVSAYARSPFGRRHPSWVEACKRLSVE